MAIENLKLNKFYEFVRAEAHKDATGRYGVRIFYIDYDTSVTCDFRVTFDIFWSNIVRNRRTEFEEFNSWCKGFYYFGDHNFTAVPNIPATENYYNHQNTRHCITELSGLKENTYYELVKARPTVSVDDRVGFNVSYIDDGEICQFWLPFHVFRNHLVCRDRFSYSDFNKKCIGFMYFGGLRFTSIYQESVDNKVQHKSVRRKLF